MKKLLLYLMVAVLINTYALAEPSTTILTPTLTGESATKAVKSLDHIEFGPIGNIVAALCSPIWLAGNIFPPAKTLWYNIVSALLKVNLDKEHIQNTKVNIRDFMVEREKNIKATAEDAHIKVSRKQLFKESVNAVIVLLQRDFNDLKNSYIGEKAYKLLVKCEAGIELGNELAKKNPRLYTTVTDRDCKTSPLTIGLQPIYRETVLLIIDNQR